MEQAESMMRSHIKVREKKDDKIYMRAAADEIRVVKCVVCEQRIEEPRTFTCRKCRRAPLCTEHRDREYKTCLSCSTEERMRLYNEFLRQEENLSAFLRLTQFVFLIAAIFFCATRLFAEHMPDYIRENVFFEHPFLWGGLTLVGMVLCYLSLLSQKRHIEEIDMKIRGYKAYQKSPQY